MNLTQNIWHTEIEYQCKSIYRENIQKQQEFELKGRPHAACGINYQFDQLCPILTNEVYCVKNINTTTQNHVLMHSLEQYIFYERICLELSLAFDDYRREDDADCPVTLHAPVQNIRLINAFV